MRHLFHLRVHGDPFERGFAHGIAAAAHRATPTLLYFSRFIHDALMFGAGSRMDRIARRTLASCIRLFVERRYVRNGTPDAVATLRGFAAGSGIPYSDVQAASVMPDAYLYLLGRHARRLRLPPSTMGCSAFVASTPRWVHARNLDFPASSDWIARPMVSEGRPNRGQQICSVGSLGIPSQGITGMNESGLTLSLNLNYTRDVDLDGVPITQIGEEILRWATSMDDVRKILRDMRPGAGWSFLVGSSRERGAVLFEMAGRSCVEHEFLDRPRTNHYLDEGLREGEYWLSPRRKLDSLARERHCSPAPTAPEYRLKAYEGGWGPSQLHTVNSVLLYPLESIVRIAVGPAPVANNPFVDMSVGTDGPEGCHAMPIADAPAQSNRIEARRWFAKAYASYFPVTDAESVLDALARAEKNDPASWAYPFFQGMMKLKIGEYAGARESIERSLLCDGDEDALALRTLYLARTLDLLKDRNRALASYAQGESAFRASERLQGFVQGRKRPFLKREAQRLFLDFTILDVVEI